MVGGADDGVFWGVGFHRSIGVGGGGNWLKTLGEGRMGRGVLEAWALLWGSGIFLPRRLRTALFTYRYRHIPWSETHTTPLKYITPVPTPHHTTPHPPKPPVTPRHDSQQSPPERGMDGPHVFAGEFEAYARPGRNNEDDGEG